MAMDYWLSRFIIECRRKNGKPYPPSTLYNTSASIQRELWEVYGRTDVNILDKKDAHFSEFRKQLDSRMKELTNEGIGIHKDRADPVSEDDEIQLWEKGVIGHSDAQALCYGVFFYNCKVFGFRGGDEHRNLDVNQYSITMESGCKVLTFMGRNSKNVQGGLNQRKVKPKKIKQFESPENPRCVVKLFEKYLQSIPPTGPFYRKRLPNNVGGAFNFLNKTLE
ncbi:uncharacterized protein LOC128559095 [Mercenaria mercenaria]|uniref:uncharacterized protein LOC128559095 n=1 Tax=Mercenaria mercenaria TaxID=6596 RepID=UPI00234E682F|nr:uncharacterized protein LOC128559095 [Mercenaria mercenaria]